MLTKTQKERLANMPVEKANKVVHIKPYNPTTSSIARKIINQIKKTIPKVRLKFMGASALGIAGLNDIDIWIFCSLEQREKYIRKLSIIFKSKISERFDWKWTEQSIPISVKLANTKDINVQGQLVHFKVFSKNKDILKNYEDLKISLNGKTYREYATAKKDFLMRMYFMNTPENIKNLKYLEKIGAVLINGHVIKPSGKHAKFSFTKYKLYRHTKETFYVAREIAKQFIDKGVEVVIGLATGGDILSELVAYQLEHLTKKKVFSFYAKKKYDGTFVFRDNSNRNLIKGKKTLVVDDTINTGKEITRFISFLRELDAHIIGVGVICTRNGILAGDIGVPNFYTFINHEDKLSSYLPKDCPMCKRKIPINTDFWINT